jgi:pimeloyl-ACP methyl ester carboxylesterase
VRAFAANEGRADRRLAPWPVPAELALVDVNGYPLAYQDAGAGPAIVLLHGSLTDYRSWTAQVPALSKQFRVLAPSLRHYYPEPWDGRGDDFSIAQHADDVAAFVARLAVGRVHLLGHSRGGAVALTVARRYPQLVATLVLADPRGLESLLPDTAGNREMEFQLRNHFATLQRNLAAGDVDRAAREFVDALGGAGAWERRPANQRQIFLDNLATAVDTGEFPVIRCADVDRLDFPMLLITGERSPQRYPAMFAALRACRPSIPAPVTIPAAAHAMHRENPERFNAEVLAFLARVG